LIRTVSLFPVPSVASPFEENTPDGLTSCYHVAVQAGAGIVHDSTPEHEFKESLKKASALWHVLQPSPVLEPL
jgi:hypothetical protein